MRLRDFILSFGILLAAAAGSARADYDSDAAARKADWLFMEALQAKGADHDDAHYSLMVRALDLAPDKQGREAYEAGVRRLLFAHMQSDSIAFAEAMDLCEGYFRAHPADTYAGAYLARIYAETGNTDRALEIYSILEESKPNSTALAANHADLLLSAGRFDEAIGLYRGLEKSLGRSTALTQRISNVMVWKGDTLAALKEVDDFINANPRSIDALHLGAAAATQFGQERRALEYVDRARAIDPANGSTYYYAANAYRKLGMLKEYDEAIAGAIAGEEVDRDSKVDLVQFYLSSELDSVTSSPKAQALLESLVAQYPHDGEIRRLMMSYYVVGGDWLAAAEQVEAAIDSDPSMPENYEALARLYYSANDTLKALGAVSRGIEHFPEIVDFYELKAGLLSNAEDYAGAIATLRQYIEADTAASPEELSRVYSSMADIAQKDPGVGSASELYEKALELDPDNDLAMNNYAYHLSTSGGDLLRAKELIATAVLHNPGSATYYDTYAWVLFRLGDLQEAKQYIDLALMSNSMELGDDSPAIAEVLLHAGDIYNAIGQKDKAKEYWTRAAAIADADPDVSAQAAQRLHQ